MIEVEPPLDFLLPAQTQDMDLIDILWRQDMDLGVGREVYDLNMRRELEKERELELLKEQEKEAQEKLLKEKAEESQQLEQNLNFIIDGETGEVIQVPIPAPGLPTDSPTLPQQESVDGYKVLEEEQEYLQQQQQQQQQYLQQQQQQQQQQYLQQQQTQLPQPSQPASNTDLQDEIEAIILSASQQFNTTQPEQVDAEGQSVLEQQWAEVAELLSQEELGLDVASSGALLQNATLSAAMSETPGSFNQTVAELSSAAPGGYSMMPPSTMTNQTFEPFPAATATNETMHDPTYGSLFNLDTQHLMFANMSMSGSGESTLDVDRNSTLNHTENLLQELMETTDLSGIQFPGPVDSAIMQSLQESLTTGNVSSDSAVSSMSSPPHLQDVNETVSVFSDHMSAYGSLQGATGGSDYDSAGETNSKVSKHINYNNPPYGSDLDYHMSDGMNQSIASNDSDSHYADMTQVNHNHTYPMQPGPDPREQRRTTKAPSTKSKKKPLPDYDTKIASARDARKARQLKVPFSMDNIILSSVDEFNEMLSKHDLSEPQLQLIRDIRRRGKNKVAAQNCRKRKMDVITDLEEEVMRMRQKKEDLVREQQNVEHQRTEMKHKLDAMYQEVFNSMRDEHGQPYDPSRYSLQHAEDGSVLVVPRNCTRESHKEKGSKKKKSSKKN